MIAGVLVPAALVMTTGILSPFIQPGSLEAQRAEQRYQEGDWVGAAEHFQKAEARDPSPLLRYNLGTAVYQGQNYPEAVQAFGASVPSDDVSANQISYNLGNALYRTQNLEGALQAYRQALRDNPDDEDARYNYELVLRQMQSQDQQQDQQQQEQDQNQDQDQDQENQDQNSQSSPPDSSQTGDQQQQQQAENQDQQQQDQQQQQEQDQNQDQNQEQEDQQQQQEQQQQQANQAEGEPAEEQFLKPEDAVRLLNAVTPEERELIRARLKTSSRRRVEKDW